MLLLNLLGAQLLSGLLITALVIDWTLVECKNMRTAQPHRQRAWVVFAFWLVCLLWHVVVGCIELCRPPRQMQQAQGGNNAAAPWLACGSLATYILRFAKAVLGLLAVTMTTAHFTNASADTTRDSLWISMPLILSFVAIARIREPPTDATLLQYDRDVEMGPRGDGPGQ